MMRDIQSIKDEVRVIKTKVDQMDHNVDDILAEVTSERSQIDSLVALNGSLQAKVNAALAPVGLPADVQAKINQIFDGVEANKAAVMAGLNANTPAANVDPVATGPAPAAAATG